MPLSRLRLVSLRRLHRSFSTSPSTRGASEVVVRDFRGTQRKDAEIAAFSSTKPLRRPVISAGSAAISNDTDLSVRSSNPAKSQDSLLSFDVLSARPRHAASPTIADNASAVDPNVSDDPNNESLPSRKAVTVKDPRNSRRPGERDGSENGPEKRPPPYRFGSSKPSTTTSSPSTVAIDVKSFRKYFETPPPDANGLVSTRSISAEGTTEATSDTLNIRRSDDLADTRNDSKQECLENSHEIALAKVTRPESKRKSKRREARAKARAKGRDDKSLALNPDRFPTAQAMSMERQSERPIASTSLEKASSACDGQPTADQERSARVFLPKDATKGKRREKKVAKTSKAPLEVQSETQLPLTRVWRDDDVHSEELSRRFFSIEERQPPTAIADVQRREMVAVLPLARKLSQQKEEESMQSPIVQVMAEPTPIKETTEMKQYGNYSADSSPAYSQHPSLFGAEQIRMGFEAPLDAPKSLVETLAPFFESGNRSYVSVLADADQLFFLPYFLRRGAAGALEACQHMHQAIERDLRRSIDRERIRVKLLCNLGGLRTHLLKELDIHPEVFSEFNEAFLHYAPFFDFTHCGTQSQAADIRVKANLSLDAFNPECERIYLGGLGDYGYLKELHLIKDAQDEEAFGKLRLLCMPDRIKESPFYGLLRQKEVDWGYQIFLQRAITYSAPMPRRRL